MAGIDLDDSEIVGMLRRVYNAFENKIFPVVTPLLAQIDKATPKSRFKIKWGGANAYFPVTIGQPGGLYSSPDGSLPPSSAALERQANENVKRLYVRRQVDGLAITGTQSKEAAFRPLAEKIVTEATIACKLGMQRMSHGDSRGIIDIVVTTGTSTCVVSKPYGITGSGQGGLTLEPGQTYQILDPAGAGTPRTVTGGPGNNRITLASYTESGDNATMTFKSGESVASITIGDLVVLATGNSTAYSATVDDTTSQAGEINGLTNIVNRDGSTFDSLHALSAATAGNALWDGIQMVAGTDTPTTNPTEDDIYKASVKLLGRSGMNPMENPSDWLLITTPGLVQALAQSVVGQRVLVNEVELKAGYKGVRIAGLPAIADYWCPAGTIYMIHLPSLFKINAKDFGYVVRNGAGPWRWIDGYDAFETSWGAYVNLGTVNRTCHLIITGYTDTLRATHVVS